MKVLVDGDLPLQEKTAIALGLFDGFHAGHMELLHDIKRHGYASIIYTFDMKPTVRDMIFTPQEKLGVAATLGIDYYYEQTFDETFSHMEPEAFVGMLVRRFGMVWLTVGFDFRFGRDAVGDTALLEQLQQKYGYRLNVIPKVVLDGYKVSSSAIRELVREGDVVEAARLLTRRYFIEGPIEHGNSLGGKIGFPTANITTEKLLPSYGVYATLVETQDGTHPAVTNVGTKPTVQQGGAPNVETFILDYRGNLYGSTMRVLFVKKLRDEVKFGSVDELQAQIARDSENARRVLSGLDARSARE